MALIERLIDVIFVLGEGSFGTDGSNTVKLSGLRASARITNAGGRAMGNAEIRIWGMTLSVMNKLSTLGMIITAQRKNSVTVVAGDAGSPLSTVFQGTITNAWADFHGAPDVPFHVVAHTGLFEAVRPAQTISINGTADVATLLSGLAAQMGFAFENNGVSVKLSNPYFSGSARNQALAIVKHAGIEWNACANGVLAIWYPGQTRSGVAPLISPETGLVGYPTYTSKGVLLKTIFNPTIGLGSKVNVKSSLTPANGTWAVFRVDHDIESQATRGRWFTLVNACPVGQQVVA